MAKRTGNNRFNMEWVFAKQVWDALKNNQPVPPVPNYDIWEVEESGGQRKIIGHKPITPMKVVCNGTTAFAE